MKTDITYCNWLCSNENCVRNLSNTEGMSKEEFEKITQAAFTDCPNYGSTAGMVVPMEARNEDH